MGENYIIWKKHSKMHSKLRKPMAHLNQKYRNELLIIRWLNLKLKKIIALILLKSSSYMILFL